MSDSAVRTFKLRRGRVTPTQAAALARLWPRFGVDVDGSPLQIEQLFARSAPVVLDIGFGMGEATWQMAASAPESNVLAVDVHTPGIGSLLKLIEKHGLDNVRVADGDVLILLRNMLPDGSLSGVRVFFPDPWPKSRHEKRRLLTPGFCDLTATRMRAGALLHIATDWEAYALHVRQLLADHDAFALLPPDEAPARPVTRFERLGFAAGRTSYDVVAWRR